jgi:hypothetical protein
MKNTKILLVGDFNVDAHNYEKKKMVRIFINPNIIHILSLLEHDYFLLSRRRIPDPDKQIKFDWKGP